MAFCWAHVRRRFYELAAAGPAPIASEALERIASLYAVETDIRGQAVDERRRVRQERSRPIVEALHAWLKAQLERVSQKGKLAEANGVDPQGYITDVITHIVPGHPNSRLDELLPWAHAAPVRAVA